MSDYVRVDLPEDKIREYCAGQPILRLSVFGSALRNELTPTSDIDLLVEYEPNARVSYFDMGRHFVDLMEIIDRRIDLCTPQSISKYFRQDVIESAIPIYAKEP
ncbi:MAG: nucleotidyltransferase domain-containing protein [Chloroflexi bacterium]|nr:nucleotidyltransferase domain-containing protein [Chloroflexota bacterium]